MCILFHDYEVFDNRWDIRKVLHDYLISMGFKVSRNTNITYFWKDDIRIYDCEYDSFDTIDACIPYFPKTKVCVRCGKVKINYNINDCKLRLDHIIEDKIKTKEKMDKALSILEGRNERWWI